jgi:hypothetical protein
MVLAMDANRSLDLLSFTIDFNTVDFHRQRMHLQRFVPSLYCQSGGVLPDLWQHCLQDAVGGARGAAVKTLWTEGS